MMGRSSSCTYRYLNSCGTTICIAQKLWQVRYRSLQGGYAATPGQVLYERRAAPSSGEKHVLHRFGRVVSQLYDEPSAGLQGRLCLACQAAIEIEAVVSGEEREVRLVLANLGARKVSSLHEALYGR